MSTSTEGQWENILCFNLVELLSSLSGCWQESILASTATSSCAASDWEDRGRAERKWVLCVFVCDVKLMWAFSKLSYSCINVKCVYPSAKTSANLCSLFLSPPATGQVVPGPQSEQRSGGLLHPRRGPGPGHAGGPHWILLQVTQRGQENEGGGPAPIPTPPLPPSPTPLLPLPHKQPPP